MQKNTLHYPTLRFKSFLTRTILFLVILAGIASPIFEYSPAFADDLTTIALDPSETAALSGNSTKQNWSANHNQSTAESILTDPGTLQVVLRSWSTSGEWFSWKRTGLSYDLTSYNGTGIMEAWLQVKVQSQVDDWDGNIGFLATIAKWSSNDGTWTVDNMDEFGVAVTSSYGNVGSLTEGVWLTLPINAHGLYYLNQALEDGTISFMLMSQGDYTEVGWQDNNNATMSMTTEVGVPQLVIKYRPEPYDAPLPGGSEAGGSTNPFDPTDFQDTINDTLDSWGWGNPGGKLLFVLIAMIVAFILTYKSKLMRVVIPLAILAVGIVFGMVSIWLVGIMAIGIGFFAYKMLAGSA